jgi:uncharacterized membrane protein YoaK (UPF0700 family)
MGRIGDEFKRAFEFYPGTEIDAEGTPGGCDVEASMGFLRDDKHGPLPRLLLVLTMVTGLVDAVSYLKLGNVFVANMTGNVVFLAFAVVDPEAFSIPASLTAIGAFMAGALAGGRLAAGAGHHRGRFLATGTYIEIALVGAAFLVALAAPHFTGALVKYALIVLLALAMGLQNAVARRLGVPDLTTTVLTLTMTGLAADSTAAGGKNPSPGRRLMAIATMFGGAAIGAYLIFHAGIGAALALALVLLVLNGFAAYRISSATDAWTVGV